MAIHNLKNNQDSELNFMDLDTIPLDIREGSEYDKRRNKPEYDNDTSFPLSPSGERSISPFLSFPCLTRESSRKMNHFFSGYSCQSTNMTRMINQSGRSMVEMLGTLAVIGVLSIGGIAGYSYGMDKYRSNETINDVNLRAMDLITQLTQGATPTLASWVETGTAGYPISLYTDETTTNHYIKVEKVPFRVCDIISDTMPESVVIEVNNDTEQCADGENTMYFAYAGFDKDESAENITVCPAGTSTSGRGGYAGIVLANNYRCHCENADTKWDSASSSCVPQDGTCSSFADCNSGEYCQFSPENASEIPTSGVCNNLSACGEIGTYSNYWMSGCCSSNCYTDWWTSQDICSAMGMNMVSISDIGCEKYTDGSGQSCVSETLIKIREAGLSKSFWTITPGNYGEELSWSINFYENVPVQTYRHAPNVNDVLCRK